MPDSAEANDTAEESEKKVSVSRIIPHPPEAIFELLSSPSGHVRIDGSGMVQGDVSGPERLELGSSFRMKMKLGVVPYRIKSTVKEFEENRLIAWGHFGGHRWRYELEPVDGGTRVTETFDWSTAPGPAQRVIEMAGYPTQHPANMEATLERIEQVLDADT